MKYDNGFPDLVFTAIDGNGGVPDAVTINVTPDGYTSPVFSGTTRNGVFEVKIAPPANYAWTASTSNTQDPISSGTKAVNSCQGNEKPSDENPCFEIDVTNNQALLMAAMTAEFTTCTNGMTDDTFTPCNKGLALLAGLSELLDPSGSLAKKLPTPTSNNSETTVLYLRWLAELKESLDNQKPSIPNEVWDTINIEIAAGRETLQDLGKIPQIPDHSLPLPHEFAVDSGDTVDYLVDALRDPTDAKQAFRVGGVAFGLVLIVYGFADLLIFSPETGPLVFFPDVNCRDFSPGSACSIQAEKALRLYADVLQIADGLAILVKVASGTTGGLSTAATSAAYKILFVVVIITTVLQVLDIYNRYGNNWGQFVSDLTSLNPSLWLELTSVAGGIIFLLGLALKASTLTVAGAVIGVVLALAALGLYIWSLIDLSRKFAELDTQLSRQITGLYQLREFLLGTRTTLKNSYSARLRDESRSLASYATVTGQFASLAKGNMKDDFLWMNYYFGRLSRAEAGLATKVDTAREAVDDLLKAFLYYDNPNEKNCVGGTDYCTVIAQLVGYHVTKAEFPGNDELPAFTFNAATYGLQSDGQPYQQGWVGFERYEVFTDLFGYSTTEQTPDNVVKWSRDIPRDHDASNDEVQCTFGVCQRSNIDFLGTYAATSSQQPSSACGTAQHFCFLKPGKSCDLSGCHDIITTIRHNDVYASDSRLILDESNRPQTFTLYKWYLDFASNDCAPFHGIPCCGIYDLCVPNIAFKEWGTNINRLTPIVQKNLDQLNEAFHEYDSAAHLKKPVAFPFAFSTQWPMILNGGHGPSVVANDTTGVTNSPGLAIHGLPAIWYVRCGGTINLCDLNRLDPSNNQTADWILGRGLFSGIEAPPGTEPTGIGIDPSTGDIFWTMNRTDGQQVWRKSSSGETFTYWNTSVASGAWGLSLDSQGNPVFAEANTNSIVQLVLESNLIRRFSVGSVVKNLVRDPSDPNEVWFTEENANKIGRLDISTCDVPTCGLLYEWSIPTAGSQPSGITIDSNGNVWFAENAANRIARLNTVTNDILEYPTGIVKSPRQITIATPNRLFVTEASGAVDVVSTDLSSEYIRGGVGGQVLPDIRQLDFQTASASSVTTSLIHVVYPTVPTRTTLYGSDSSGVERFQLLFGSNPQGISDGVGVGNMFYADFGLHSIARFDGPVTTIPTISPASSAPVAVAGPDRIVEGNTNLGATLTLDGSDSNDPSGSPLTYSWSGDCGTATGPKPVVFCLYHPHNTANTVKLVVNNGKTDSDPAFVKVTVVDTTPPTITSVRAPPPNSEDWTNHTVTVSFQCSDIVSGISFVSDPVVLPSEGRNVTANGYCTDGAGNIASKTVTDINIDKTPPTISGSRSPGPDANGWNNVDVTVHFECNDTLSGIASCTPDAVLTNEGRNQSVTGFATDFPGNGAKTTVSGISIDKTPPVISTAQDGIVFILHQTVYADAHCGDALSGVDTCAVPTGVLDTGTVGQHSYTVTATDKAGNGAVFVVRYQVHYYFISFSMQPSGKGTQIGRTVPVRFQLTDALGSFVPTVTAQIWIDSQTNPGKSSGSANTGNYFRFDPSSSQYLFNLSTTGMTTGSHTVYITLDDGTVHAMVIGLTS